MRPTYLFLQDLHKKDYSLRNIKTCITIHEKSEEKNEERNGGRVVPDGPLFRNV